MPYVIPILSLIIAGYISFNNLIVHWNDFFIYVGWAEDFIRLSNFPYWISPVFPIGYPLLLKLFFFITGDYLIAARIISLVGGGLCVLFTYKIVYSLLKDRKLAFLSQLFLFSSLFIQWFFLEGSDTLALSFQLISVYFIIKDGHSNSDLVISGVFAGLAYMMRYQSLILIPITFFWIIYGQKRKEESPLEKAFYYYLLFFLIASFPQLYISLFSKGNPFWMCQGKNIWFGIYGDKNWVSNWARVPYDISVLNVIMLSPLNFFNNWFKQFILGIKMIQPMFPLNLFASAGLLLSLFAEINDNKKNIFFILIITFAILFFTSMAFVTDRLLIFAYPFMTIFSLKFIDMVIPTHLTFFRRVRISFKLLFLIVILSYMTFFVCFRYLPSYHNDPRFITSVKVSKVLRENGMTTSNEVFSSSTDLYDHFSSKKERFPIFMDYGTPEKFSIIEKLVKIIKEKEVKFLIYEEMYGYVNYPGLQELFDPSKAPSSFHLIYKQEAYPRMAIYKIY